MEVYNMIRILFLLLGFFACGGETQKAVRVSRSIHQYPFRGNCYDCNSEPWIPIIGRSLNLQASYFREELPRPLLDQYGAPQGGYEYPKVGEVVDFMLPPPYRATQYKAPVRVGWFRYSRPTILDLIPPPLPVENHLPPAQPSDSYGRPLVNQLEPLTLGSEKHFGYHSDVQVVPSVRIADYTASIEHPINLIQSPILDVEEELRSKPSEEENNKLSEKPIVVEDTFTSASDINTTYSSGLERAKFLTQSHTKEGLIQKLLEEQPKIHFNSAGDNLERTESHSKDSLIQKLLEVKPKIHFTSASNINLESHSKESLMQKLLEVKPKSKKLQIIVPYLKAPSAPSTAIYNRDYTTLAPVFVPPPLTTEPSNLWTQLVEEIRTGESQKGSARGFLKPTTEVYNIHEYFSKKSLQQNIDNWTQQSYSTHRKSVKDHSTSPSEHLDVISNEVLPQTTPKPTVKYVKKPSWEKDRVTLKNSTHEKVYLVTPQSYVKFLTTTPATVFSMAPQIQNGQINNATTMTRISVRVEAPSPSHSDDVKVIFSEWPHLINDLETTTTSKPTSRHPLFGLMDMAAYTSEPGHNGTVETLSGHSKVASFGTSPLKVGSTTPLPKVDTNATVTVTPAAL